MARIAILDANVLWPPYLRDALIRISIYGVYRAGWTEQIIEEMRNSLIRKERVSAEQIDRTVRFMRENCPHFMIEGYKALIPVMTNDPKDRHVLAAAVRAGADTIVTDNQNDFPAVSCEPYGIDVHSPDEFLCDLWITDTMRVARALVEMAAQLKKPPMIAEHLLEAHLARQAPTFAHEVLASSELTQAAQDLHDGVPLPHFTFL